MVNLHLVWHLKSTTFALKGTLKVPCLAPFVMNNVALDGVNQLVSLESAKENAFFLCQTLVAVFIGCT